MKRTASSSTTCKACPKNTSRGRRASSIVCGSIPTAITPCTPGRYGNGGSGSLYDDPPAIPGCLKTISSAMRCSFLLPPLQFDTICVDREQVDEYQQQAED